MTIAIAIVKCSRKKKWKMLSMVYGMATNREEQSINFTIQGGAKLIFVGVIELGKVFL